MFIVNTRVHTVSYVAIKRILSCFGVDWHLGVCWNCEMGHPVARKKTSYCIESFQR